MGLDVEAALVKMEAWEARVAALSRAVRADLASPYRRLWAADCSAPWWPGSRRAN